MSIIRKIRKFLCPQKKYISFLRKTGAKIGEDCEIYKSANFGSEPYLITIGNHVRINSGVQLITHDGGIWVLRKGIEQYERQWSDADKFGKIIIGNNVHIGTNAVIMPGVTIGNNVIIGCSSVVTHNIPDNTVVAGVPARFIETIDEYFKKNEHKLVHTKNLKEEQKRKVLLDLFANDGIIVDK